MMTFNKNIIDSIVLWQCGTVERGKIVGTLYKKLNIILFNVNYSKLTISALFLTEWKKSNI